VTPPQRQEPRSGFSGLGSVNGMETNRRR